MARKCADCGTEMRGTKYRCFHCWYAAGKNTCSTPKSTADLRRVKIRFSGTVYGYANKGEKIDKAVERIALESEMAINNTQRLRADVQSCKQIKE